nr:MAG TPA: hypothetical protein [Caudoviricetes sp.]
MDRWEYYNPNPAGNRVGDCAVRAICKATGFDWETVFYRINDTGMYSVRYAIS